MTNPVRTTGLFLLALALTACDGTGGGGGIGGNEELVDLDGDGYYVNAINQDDQDCNDGDPTINPDPETFEACDRIDNNCNGKVDDEATDASEWFPDSDGDGFGLLTTDVVIACFVPDGYTADSSDCNDNDSQVYPLAPERCNQKDDDCDTYPDNGLPTDVEWFDDRDHDGFGGGEPVVVGCTDDPTLVRNDDDCNDLRDAVRPGAPEICDGFDNDCDGKADDQDDELTGALRYYDDVDGDGYGDVLTGVIACIRPFGTVTNYDDCDDADPLRSPQTWWYRDDDRDGFGDIAFPWPYQQCWQPIGYAMNTEDCDDLDPLVASGTIWHPDADRDGYGGPEPVGRGCASQTGWALSDQDCDDRDPAINPGVDEICDTKDNDCDGKKNDNDDDTVGQTTWYLDGDGDTWGLSTQTKAACLLPSGYTDRGGDCNDHAAILNPETRWWADSDRDGWGDPASAWPTPSCEVVPGHVPNDEDCDDTRYEVSALTGWYADLDGDGIGDGVDFVDFGCLSDPHLSLITGDCDDADPLEVSGTCFGPDVGRIHLVVHVDLDGGSGQKVRVDCIGEPVWSEDIRGVDAGDDVVYDLDYATGRQCRVTLEGPRTDLSADGASTVDYSVCGVDAGTVIGLVDLDVTSAPLTVTRCSGCTDPAADNYDATVLVSTDCCIYSP